MTNKDKYDLAIENLTASPEKIYETWNDPLSVDDGCLFMYADKNSGCLTQIRARPFRYGSKLAQAAEIADDERIPIDPTEITVESLPVFAEWQRRLDRELGENRNNKER